MENQKKTVKSGTSGLVKALYIIAAVLIAVCVYMIIVNVMYINNYAATYGMKVSDMMMDAVQYVITGSISYFVYGLLVFCAGKVINLLQKQERIECTAEDNEERSGEGDLPESEDAVEKTEEIDPISEETTEEEKNQ